MFSPNAIWRRYCSKKFFNCPKMALLYQYFQGVPNITTKLTLFVTRGGRKCPRQKNMQFSFQKKIFLHGSKFFSKTSQSLKKYTFNNIKTKKYIWSHLGSFGDSLFWTAKLAFTHYTRVQLWLRYLFEQYANTTTAKCGHFDRTLFFRHSPIVQMAQYAPITF